MARRITLNIVTTSDAKGIRETKRALSDLASTIRKLNGEFSKLAGLDAFRDVGTGINRLTRDMEQLTRAQKELRAELKRGASDAERAANGYRDASKAQEKYTQSSREFERQQRRTKKATQETSREFEMIYEELGQGSSALRRASRDFERMENTMRDVARTADLSEDKFETFWTTMRDAGKTIGSLDKQRRTMKELYEDLQRGEQEVTQAMQRRRQAQERLDALMSTPGRSNRQIEEARRELEAASRASSAAEKNFAKYENRLESMRRDLQQVADVQERLNRYQSDPEYAKFFADPRIAGRINTMRDALESFETVGRRMGTTLGNSLNRIRSGIGSLKQMDSDTENLVKSLRDLVRVGNDVGRLGMDRFAKAIGNPIQAINQATRAIQQQHSEAIRLGSTVSRIDDGIAAWASAERQLQNALTQGNNAMRMRNQVTQAFGSARGLLQGASTQIEQQRVRLLQQQNRLAQEAVNLQTRLAAAEARREGIDRSNIADYERATDAINELRQAMERNDQAIQANRATLAQNASQASRVASEFSQLQAATGRMNAQFAELRSVASANVFGRMIGSLRGFVGDINQLATALQGRLVAAIQRASSALRQFVSMSGGAMFAGLQRSLQSIGNGFNRFADNVVNSMNRSRNAMMEFYAAGYSLLTVGSQLQQFGFMINRSMGQQLDTYMDYERARNFAAIAGAEPVYRDGSRGQEGNWRSGIASFDINTEIVDRIIRGMQYGTYTPEWLNPSGQPIPVAFDAKELAQGLYYYSSAIGVPITAQNEREVAGVITTIMQAAKVTDTGIETAVKGTMNVAMEFGYDPRDLSPENAKEISSITARMAYLANISTMEMSDIAETFKMVGPQAHFLSPGALAGDPGAGLNETFLLAFLASEVGLRGGNVGRGINQAFTSLLDPTEKMLEVAGKHFGEGEKWTTEQFNEFFKEGGALKGGIRGFLETLQTIPREAQATMLAELFTSNATRALMGPVLAGGDFDIDRFLTEMDENPFIWLEAAVAETANSVNGWFQFMKNGWFQFTRSIIDSVSGPLMGGFEFIGTFLFEMAEALTQFPQLGQIFAGIAGALGTLSVIGGTALMAAGSILILGRSFAMLGGFIGPALRMFAFAGVTLLGLIPALLGIAVAVGVLRGLWTTDFMGMRSAFESFTEGVDLRSFMNDVAQGATKGFLRLTTVIDQFASGILLARGPVNDLFAAMNSVFGPKLGSVMIAGLMQLRHHMRGVRADFESMTTSVSYSGNIMEDVGLSIQGFLETLALGSARAEAVEAMDRIGEVFGQTNFSANIMSAARSVGEFVATVVNYGSVLVGVWTSMMGDIYSNIIRVFSSDGLSGIFSGIGNVLEGIFLGIISTITVVLGVIESVTGRIADMAESLRNAGDAGTEILGFTITFNGAMQALGVTLGAFLGARLLLSFSPLAALFARLVPLVTGLGAVLVGLGGRFAVVAAQAAILTAGWIAQAAVIAVVAGAKMLLIGLNMSLAAAQTAASAASAGSTASMAAQGGVVVFLAGVYTVLTGAIASFMGVLTGTAGVTSVAAAANTLLAASLTAVAAASVLVVVAMAGIILILGAIAVGALALVFATEGVSAGFSALASLAQGIWAGLQVGIAVIAELIGAFMSLVGAIGGVLGAGNQFYTLGVLIGGAASVAMIAISALAMSTTLLAARMVVVGGAVAAFRGAMILSAASVTIFRVALAAVQASVASAAAAMLVLRGVMALVRAGALASAAAMAVGWLVSLGPIALVGAAIVGLGVLIWAFRDDIASALSGIADAWNNVWMGIKLVGATIIEGIVNLFINGINEIISAAADFASSAGIGGLPDVLTDKMKFEIDPVDYTSGIETEIRQNQLQRQVRTLIGGVNSAIDSGSRETEEKVSTFRSIMDKLGLGGLVDDISVKLGIDLDNASLSDLQSLFTSLTEIDGIQEQLDAANVDWTPLLGPKADEYQKALDEWNQYNDLVKSRGKAFADEFYQAQGWDIPTAPDMSDYMESAEDLDDAAKTFDEAAQEWKAAVDSLNNMSVPEKLSALFDPLAGEGGKSLIGFVAGISDTIIQAAQAGGGGQWLNMDELLADVAGSGVRLDENIAGRNIHKALAPAMKIISDQTGIAIEDLLADVPKFYAPEQYLNAATVDMVQGIADFTSQYGTELFTQLDTLGTDWLNEAGVPMEEFGLEWAELNQYAIGKALAGQDWNLADYLAESWDVSVQEAEDYLASKGIDAEAISSEWYSGVEEAILSNAGAFNALTTEQFEWLEGATNGFTTNVISMTRDAWMSMSDTQKQILTQMGYNFVIDDIIPQEALNNARTAIQDFADILGGQGVDFPTEIKGMREWAASWGEVERFTNEAGQQMVTLQDELGNQITVPAVVYDEFIRSLDLVTHHAEEAERRYAEIREKFAKEPMKLTGATAGTALDIAVTGLGDGKSTVYDSLGFTLPDVQAVSTEIRTTISEAFSQGVSEADIQGELSAAVEGIELKVKVGVDLAEFNAGIRAMDTGLNALNLVDYKIKVGMDLDSGFNAGIRAIDAAMNAINLMEYKIKVGMDLDSGFNAGIRAIDTAISALNLVEYKVKIGADTSSFNATITGMNLNASLIPPIKVPVRADMSNFWSTVTAFGSGNAGGGPNLGSTAMPTITVPVTAKITGFSEMTEAGKIIDVVGRITSFDTNAGTPKIDVIGNLTSFAETTTVPTVNAKALIIEFSHTGSEPPVVNATANITTFEVSATVPPIDVAANITQTGGEGVGQLISGLISLAGVFAATWTATLAQSGGAGVGSLISGLIKLGGQFATTYTATLAQSGGAGVGSLISGLIKLLGVYAGTYTATLSVSDGASGTLNNVLSLLRSIDGYNATSTVTTNVVTRTQTVNLGTVSGGVRAARGGRIGSAAMDRRRTTDIWSYPGLTARATGGRVRPWEYTLVGENGPEIVKLPEGAYVHHATETANMLRRSAEGSLAMTTPTNHLAAGSSGGTMIVNNNNTREGDTYTFGDVIIQAPDEASGRAAVDRFFEQLDRRAGHKQELAKRGMVPMNDPRWW